MVLCFHLISSIFANAFWNSSGFTLSIIASIWAVRCSQRSLSALRVACIHFLNQCVLSSLFFATVNSGSAHFGSRFVVLHRNQLCTPSIMAGILFATIRRFFDKPAFFWIIIGFGLHECNRDWALSWSLLSADIIHSVSLPSIHQLFDELSSSSVSIADS